MMKSQMNYKRAYKVAMTVPITLLLFSFFLKFDFTILLVIYVLIMGCIPKGNTDEGVNRHE